MKKLFSSRVFLSILIVTILSLGLTGCDGIIIVTPSNDNTGTVKLVVSGNWYYDLKIDGTTKFSNKPEGTYTIFNVPVGSHTFEAIDTDGESYGYDSTTVYISSGTNNVYLDPVPSNTTGTVYIVIYGDYEYDIKMDDVFKFINVSSGTYTLSNVSVGDHFFEAIDVLGSSLGYDSESKYINSGSNYVYLYPDNM
jgi:hypothetical protein